MLASVLYISRETRSKRTSPEMRFLSAWYKSSFMPETEVRSAGLIHHLAHAGLCGAAAAAAGVRGHVVFRFGTGYGEHGKLLFHARAVAVRAVGCRVVTRHDPLK